MKYILFCLASFLTCLNVAHAQLGISANEEVVNISDTVLGIDIKVDKNGNLVSLRSRYDQPVDFPDRRGINTSYIIAEEKAKAQLVRFMSQQVATNRTISEIDSQTEKASRTSGNTSSGWSKDNVRNVETTLKEYTSSFAAGNLKGVVILERTYDEKKAEASVTVGINRQTSQAANQLRNSTNGNFGGNTSNNSSGNSVNSGSTQYPSQGSETQRNKNFNNF
jgi:hypothetical protein